MTSVDEKKDFAGIVNFDVSAYPNPFNSSLKIYASIQESSDYKIMIFDILGKEINEISNGLLSKGEHVFNWDSKNHTGITVPSGVYFIVVTNNSIVKAKKVLLIK